MLNVLVTGANGFIGRNLSAALKKNGCNVKAFKRSNKPSELYELLKDVDFIFHLAGEVRPESSDNDFGSSNLILTQKLVDAIKEQNRNIPILMTSTIHAIEPKSAYGKTKKEAEDVLIDFAENFNNTVYIYRLPHVFGEGCKANYNSVITTWIVNLIRNSDVQVYDRNIQMTYVYVQDFVLNAIAHLDNKKNIGLSFEEVDIKHQVTLGEVYDHLISFKNESCLGVDGNEKTFRGKLLRVYKDYELNLKNE